MDQNFIFLSELDHLKVFKPYIGKIVSEITFCEYFSVGQPENNKAGELEISFNDKSFLTFSVNDDQETILASPEALSGPNSIICVVEPSIHWRRALLSNKHPWKKIVGLKLINIESIISQFVKSKDEILTGCRCTFEDGEYIIFDSAAGEYGRFSINDPDFLMNDENTHIRFESII